MEKPTPIEKFINILNPFAESLLLTRTVRWITRDNYKRAVLTEIFVVINLIIAFIAFITFEYLNLVKIIILIFFLISFYRIFEILIYQLNALVISTTENVKSPGRMIFLLFINYFEILIWFAFYYQAFSYCFNKAHILTYPSGAFYFSVVTMTTLGYGDINPINFCGILLITFQTLIGLFIAFVMLARFIPFFNEVKRGGKMPGKKGIFHCNKCGQTVKYSRPNLRKYATDNGRLRCKCEWCEYILTKEETCEVLNDLFLKKL